MAVDAMAARPAPWLLVAIAEGHLAVHVRIAAQAHMSMAAA
jgi:hypothetical protein